MTKMERRERGERIANWRDTVRAPLFLFVAMITVAVVPVLLLVCQPQLERWSLDAAMQIASRSSVPLQYQSFL